MTIAFVGDSSVECLFQDPTQSSSQQDIDPYL